MPITHHTPYVQGQKLNPSTINEAHDYTDLDAVTLNGETKEDFLAGLNTRKVNFYELPLNAIVLWDNANGEIPSGYEALSTLSGTNLTLIKHNRGENMTEIEIVTIEIDLPANTSVSFHPIDMATELEGNEYTSLIAGGSIARITVAIPKDTWLNITFGNTSGSPLVYVVTQYDSEGYQLNEKTDTVETGNSGAEALKITENCRIKIQED